jgi:hypothetical protein
MKRHLLCLVAVVFCATFHLHSLAAEECTAPDRQDQCTARQLQEFVRARALGTVTAAQTAPKVANTNEATANPDAFAGKIHNTYQDFLNLFGFAINKVDESKDGQALTVRFNPLRAGQSLLGLTLTAAKPQIAESVRKAIPETGRSDVVTKLEGQLDDLDDLTIAASYSFQSVRCPVEDPRHRCFGRAAESYRDVLGHALASLFQASAEENEAAEERLHQLKLSLARLSPQDVASGHTNVDVLLLRIDQSTDPSAFRKKIEEFSELEAQITLNEKAFFAKHNLDALATLVDNQPQIALTGSYRSPGKLGGPTETALSAELSFGNDNLNALRAGCPAGSDACLGNALRKKLDEGVVTTTKWSLTGTYKRNDSFKLNDLGLDPPVTGFAAVDEKSASELMIKGQGGMVFNANAGRDGMRGDLSLEGHRIEKDRVRTTNRWVAVATFTVPLSEQKMSVPISLTYANKPEFLGEQGKRLGVHLGLSYRLSPLSK